MGISFLLGAGILLVRGEVFRDAANVIYAFVLLLLVAVLLFGKEVNGAKAWFAIGGFGIQPAEFAKFATALALSRYLSGLKALVDVRSRVIAAVHHPVAGGAHHAPAGYRHGPGLRCVHPCALPRRAIRQRAAPGDPGARSSPCCRSSSRNPPSTSRSPIA